ncbi:MAG TPA: cyclic nucleotide-binding domain-containing protein [Bryobacteraceae bacterium]|nr:cyclic nucleotide-binding domain-containing protein [Bryobacteraceae bacterium]
MESLERFLREHPFCRDLDENHLQLMVGCASNLRVDAGQFFFREGDPANELYLIRSGRVSVEFFAPGRGPISILTLGDGDPLGWSWLMPPYRWKFDARALNVTRALVLDGKCLRGKCEQDYKLGYDLMRKSVAIVEQRLEAARMQLLNLYGTHAEVR